MGGTAPERETTPSRLDGEAPSDTMARLCAAVSGDDVPRLSGGPDGAALIELARAHRVHLVLACRLGLAPSALAPIAADHSAWLATQMRTAALVDLFRTRELARVLTAMDEARLAPLVFKGAALAHTHYAESWIRPRFDTDILVAPGTQHAAVRVLEEVGYVCEPFVAGEFVMYQRPLMRVDGRGNMDCIDLHWRIANREAVAHALSYDDLVRCAEVVPVHEATMRVPVPEHALLIACLHRAAHHQDSENLLWLLDIHLLARRMTEDQWDRFAALAVRTAVTAICSRGIRLAGERFQTVVPPRVLDRLARAQGVDRREPSAVFLNPDVRRVDVLLSDLRCLGPRAGARLLWEMLFPSGRYMREAFAAGRGTRLWWAYGRRIVMGTWKWIRPGAAYTGRQDG